MIKFIYEPGESHRRHTAIERVEIGLSDHSTVPDILEAVKNFMSALGYGIHPQDEIILEEHEEAPKAAEEAAEEEDCIEVWEKSQDAEDGDVRAMEHRMKDPDYVAAEYEAYTKSCACTEDRGCLDTDVDFNRNMLNKLKGK